MSEYSAKFNIVKKYYDDGLWDESEVRNAVIKNWITEVEFKAITSLTY